MALGQRIRDRREELGLTQTELAQHTGIKQQTLTALETRDSKKSDHAAVIAKALHVSVEWLTTGRHATNQASEHASPGSYIAKHKEVSAKEEEQRARWIALYDNLDDSKRAHLWALGDSLNKPNKDPDCPDEKHCHHEKTG